MRDEETGSWWQQVSGEAIRGPLKGTRLTEVPHDELTFATWRSEHADGRVLLPDPAVTAGHEAPADWERRMAKVPVPPGASNDPLPARELVVGVVAGGRSAAYPAAALRQGPVQDEVGGMPIVVVLSDDGRSIRAFDRRVPGRTLALYAVAGATPLRLTDGEDDYDFTGRCVSGPCGEGALARVPVLPDYLFDWKAYHPETSVYLLGRE